MVFGLLNISMTSIEESGLSALSCLLAIDSGNTAIKWGLYDGGQWIVQGVVLQSERTTLSQVWAELPVPSSVIISNVAGMSVAKELASLLNRWRVPLKWITAKVSQCGVHNCYVNPERLGCDRWAALIAAWHILRQSGLVINVGTAMTVDTLTDTGEFLGGIIVPGPESMRQALANRTDALSIVVSGHFQDFPNNTEDALYSGMIQALTGAVERMHGLLSRHLNAPAAIIVSGGGAKLLSTHIPVPHRIIDNLVLEGLIVIAGEMSRGNT
jgi:type III pantothenate kinase